MIPFFPVVHNSGILIIDNNDSFTFNLVQLVEEWGEAPCQVVGSQNLNPELVQSFQKVLISPGPGLPADFPRMGEVIRRFGQVKDILGVCLGHEAIVLEFGGTLIHLPSVKHGVTSSLQIMDPDEELFRGVECGSPVGLYHSWVVNAETLPDCLEVTAQSEDCTILAIRHRKFRVRGVQFHPESFMTPAGKRILENWLEGGRR
ncbi:MAG: aminodeoxychorismate/anthranilate synthase component II [Bacteroidetes bacterium]|nr:MAG: aminodeoxychorismate/anthranilate synthase component II [Bacteroidota bacterium]